MQRKIKKSTAIGTQEWSVKTVNCCTGCSHDCLYCYAKEMGTRFGWTTQKTWPLEQIRQKDVDKIYKKYDGQVIDLEEKRVIRTMGSRLEHLFKKAPSKRQIHLYQAEVCKITSLSYGRLGQDTINRLHTSGIDLERLKANMELWDRLN